MDFRRAVCWRTATLFHGVLIVRGSESVSSIREFDTLQR